MSLRLNIIATYVRQLYITVLSIVILPLYIQYMGAEAYGLIGFFSMLQGWFALLDLGLNQTIGRETARFFGGSMPALEYLQLFRALSLIFVIIAISGASILFFMAKPITTRWLQIERLSIEEVLFAVEVMAISVALRWLTGLYGSVVTGAERLVRLSGFNIIIATLRFIGVFVSMKIYGYTPTVFFTHQLIVAILELCGLWAMSERLLPNKKQLSTKIGWSFKPVYSVLSFSLTIAFTSSVWVFVTQTDKLVLSGILPLDDYGYFTLAVMVASGIMVIGGPVSNAIIPRMTRLYAENKHNEMISVYRSATQLVSVIAGSASIVIYFVAEPLILVWTNDQDIAWQVTPILKLYVIGNGFLAVGAFPSYLQYALGNLRYHLIGNAILAIVLIPSIIIVATYYGAVGTGWVWFLMNALYFFVWVTYTHIQLEPGLHIHWLWNDCLSIYLPVIVIVSAATYWINQFTDRWSLLAYIGGVSLLALLVAVSSSSVLRKRVILFLRKSS